MSDNLPATMPEISAEIAAIQREMPTRAYRQDEALQARYRSLVTRRDELGDADEPEDDIDIFAIPAGADMGVARFVGDILIGTPEAERRALYDSFGALHEDVRALISAELANARTPPSFPFTMEDIAEARETPGGQILAAEWGEAFARKLSAAEGRIARLFAEFDKYERGERAIQVVTNWLLDLPPRSFASIYRKLAA